MIRTAATEIEKLPLENGAVADRLDEIAELLTAQGANPFRIRAYHAAAQTLRHLARPAHEILAAEGAAALTKLPGIGESLARSIERLARTGRLGLLDRLQGDSGPEGLFATVGGIGPATAARIHEMLGIETLAELEAAACDGRLARVPGMGRKRVQAVREALAGRFRTRPQVTESRRPARGDDAPGIEELLDVDAEYRREAAARRLPRIAPRRFNPTAEAWLPILHTKRGTRHYTALFSNTARAHELGTVNDWVVIYRDDEQGEGHCTVVTSLFGKLKGHRVVRGREAECAAYYATRPEPRAAERTLFNVT